MEIITGLGVAEIAIVVLIFGLIPFALMLFAIIDIIRSDFKDSNTKLIFFVLILFMPCLGSIIYLIIKKNYIQPKFKI
jgi:hypothetical protein